MNSLDIFGKLKDRQSASSMLGGVTSLIALVCVIILVGIHISRMKSENLHRELKIDFHKIDQHVEGDIDITLYNAPCELVSLDYQDYLGEDIHDIHIDKQYVNKQGTSEGAPTFEWGKPVSADSVKERMKDWPGCRLSGKFKEIMKVNGLLIISFVDHIGVYNELVNTGVNSLDMQYNIDHLFFGSIERNQLIQRRLQPYHEDIHSELNPFKGEKPHTNGKFMAHIHMQIFPFEVIDDINKENLSSFQYSYIKNYKEFVPGTQSGPLITFRLQFLPIVSVYHIKVLPKFKTVIGILGACGGIFSIFGILNSLLSVFTKKERQAHY
jgi:hypothetical protein